MTDEKGPSSTTGNELIAHLQASGVLDELFAKIDAGVVITGSDGLLPPLLNTPPGAGPAGGADQQSGLRKGRAGTG